MSAKPKVLMTRKMPDAVLDYLKEHCAFTPWERDETMSRAQMLEQIGDCEGVIVAGERIDEELLDRAPNLKVVSSVSVGYNHFGIEEMRKRHVIGTHTPYVLDDSVADLVLALMLDAGRRTAELDGFVKSGQWHAGNTKDEELYGKDVHHATIGMIGMGRIGEAVAKRAVLGFDMNLIYYSRTRKPDLEERYQARFCPLDEVLAQADFVVLMAPLTPETRHMIGKAQFKLMKPEAFLINASRGAIVDERALIEALQTGVIRGAGLDVFEEEPIPADHPLAKMANVVTLPHIGSATRQTRFDMAMLAARNLVGGLTGGDACVVQELRNA